MLFNSLKFLIFFPSVVVIYFIVPYRFRWLLLLGASYYFYMSWKPEYIVLIIISTLIDYFLSLKMGKITEKRKRKKYLILSIISNLGILFVFKYFNFFNNSLRMVFQQFNLYYGIPNFKLLLPVGISFYTFQTLSYTIDVYKGNREPEKHFGIFALYVSFFPQLVAGPIERSERLLPQFYENHKFNYERVMNGLTMMGWGFLKKIVIADRLAIIVNKIYNNPTEYNGFSLIVATVFFAFQIFCDFSGYSDIAIGSAKVMGIELIENFKRPYFSKSISEFWRRWHISLSTWFRDYLYIPLGGNRVSVPRYYFNIFFTFLVSGLWHGANWTFIVWGALHGFYLIMGKMTFKIRRRIVKILKLEKVPFIHKSIQIIITFGLVCFAWIFFRANSIEEAFYIVQNIFVDVFFLNLNETKQNLIHIGVDKFDFLLSILLILILEGIHVITRKQSTVVSNLEKRPIWIRWLIYYAIIFAIIVLGVYEVEEKSQFIYFQF
ncbi:D-alanyl-lipoteichoic acid acyltransferase DltB, MBOAT superfamily [Caminicella sporogenes DSM 14501]|uniref:D-alanyl-lipoteichoic acid acyltransferase DltB, MBOAT superfamily n=1 Tax=Caminicella sporogenes DSM 14501 TaxID=1121266 RepID=A0A1M6PWW8_9FIRM|nr:MBOAT family O-acyltransferase [Caminicella sporogenes]RKD21938.1 alginate O-acetyltransferase [Caminicella sporogenes]SHK12419.1 D-alanyl-lipoteichoic acid acyltransferase DltB, MBOAT superfamily [Caminicella sporogenes DSM 14501]